jgi:hypothetical protein
MTDTASPSAPPSRSSAAQSALPSAASPSAPPAAGTVASPPASAQPGQPISPPPAAPSQAGDPGAARAELKFELPPDFPMPDGMKITLDPKNPIRGPILADVAAFEREAGFTQEQFSGLLVLDARMKIAEHTAAKAELANEKTKLGANAEARLAAVANWAKTLGLSDAELDEVRLTGSTAAGVSLLEKVIAKANGSVPGDYVPARAPTPEPTSAAAKIWPNGFSAKPVQRGGGR